MKTLSRSFASSLTARLAQGLGAGRAVFGECRERRRIGGVGRDIVDFRQALDRRQQAQRPHKYRCRDSDRHESIASAVVAPLPDA